MHYNCGLALAAATLFSLAAAGNAPIVSNNPMGDTYQAILPNKGGVTGAIKGSSAPNGIGASFQVAFYNLPHTGNLSYMIHTNRVTNDDCSSTGGVLDPYFGVTDSACAHHKASCQVGDLSAKHGTVKIKEGGSGTGYFAANYVDDYISMQPGAEAFFGKGSIVISDGDGSVVACANFIDANAALSSTSSASTSATASASVSTKSYTHAKTATSASVSLSASESASSAELANSVAQTAAPVIGASVLGLAALLI